MAPHALPITAVNDTFPSKIRDVSITSLEVAPNVEPNLNEHQNGVDPVFTVEDVLPQRNKSAPISGAIAAFAEGDMFKSKNAANKPMARRWDHLISTESAMRKPSSLKAALKHFKPGQLSLAGGLPHSENFPYHQIDYKFPTGPYFSEKDTERHGQIFTARKHDYPEQKSLYDLSIALNYSQSSGGPQMLRFVTEHSEIVHNPRYKDWDCSLSAGSTQALETTLRIFYQPGQHILTDSHTFSTAIETMRPMGWRLEGIEMDADGMIAEALDRLLSNWDVDVKGGPKPFLLYLIPTGHNPTATTQPLSRRKAIYEVAEKHDLFIIEDDPYYYLQMEDYVSGQISTVPSPFEPMTTQEYLGSLIPSYVSLDRSGRVLRLDSFSKIIAPGSRCGWVTGPKQIVERFTRHSEVSTQSPSGFSMMALYKLLEDNWSHKGFLEWLMFMRAEYTRRRDVMVNACEKHLPSEIVTYTPPKAGMFHWLTVDASKHPLFMLPESLSKTDPTDASDEDLLIQIEDRIFMSNVKHGVLTACGSWFKADNGPHTGSHAADASTKKREVYFRTTFAAAAAEQIDEAVRRFGLGLREEFGLEQQ